MKITKLSVCVSMAGLMAALPAAYANEIVTNCTQVTAAGAEDIDSTPNNMVGTTVTEDDESCVKVMIPFDYGDAPDPSYQTLDASGGARHQLGTDVFLGQCVDGDSGLLQGAATADDEDAGSPAYGDCTTPDDEDGVTFGELRVGGEGATVEVVAGKECKLNAWVDWNIDGSWGGAAEQVFMNHQLSAGTNTLTLDVPKFASAGDTYARFRCSTLGDDGIGGEAADGEVEDYQVSILEAIPDKPVALGDYIWVDADQNGQQDAGETALAGAVVTLTDAAGNPVKDLAGTLVAAQTTGTDGLYLFSNLPEGDYIVSVAAPESYLPTSGGADPDDDASNTDSNCSVVGGNVQTPVISLLAGSEPDSAADSDGPDSNRTVDCGFYIPKAPVHSIGNQVWIDDGNGTAANANNGIRDDSELPVADGVVMELLDKDGKVLQYTETKDGYYLFSGLAAGEYSVCVAHGNFDQGILAGYTASTGGDETDANLNVDHNDNGENDTQDGLCSNVVILDEQEPTGEIPTASGTAGDDGMGTEDGRSNLTVDFGVIPPASGPEASVAVGNRIWLDANGNGTQDEGEKGLMGATVTLTDTTGRMVTDVDGNTVESQVTAEDGLYRFTNLPEGDYIVTVEPPAGYYLTLGGIDVDDDASDKDSNCRINPANSTIETHVFTLSAGMEPDTATDGDDANGNMTVDCGFYGTVSIGDRIWLDSNANGQQDDGEPGLGGITVSLLEEDGITPATDINGNEVASVTTGTDGIYLFDDLRSGAYIVTVEPGKDSGFSLTKGGADPDDDASNTDSNCKVVDGRFQTPATTLMPGAEPGAEFDGDDASRNSTVDCGLFRPVNLGSRVWIDLDGNGKQDGGEPGVPGATITLLDASGNPVTDVFGNPVPPQITGSNGEYFFADLREGSYVIKVTPPAGYLPTVAVEDPNNNDGNDSNGYLTEDGSVISKPIDLKWGEEPEDGGATNTTVGFGFVANLQIPTVSQWGLAFMSLLLAAAGLFRRRRDD